MPTLLTKFTYTQKKEQKEKEENKRYLKIFEKLYELEMLVTAIYAIIY